MKTTTTRVSPEKKEELMLRFNQLRISYADVARKHGCHRATVLRVLKGQIESKPIWKTLERMVRRME